VALKGERLPYGRQHAGGQCPTENEPKRFGHRRERALAAVLDGSVLTPRPLVPTFATPAVP
jgi:hypothetical protein